MYTGIVKTLCPLHKAHLHQKKNWEREWWRQILPYFLEYIPRHLCKPSVKARPASSFTHKAIYTWTNMTSQHNHCYNWNTSPSELQLAFRKQLVLEEAANMITRGCKHEGWLRFWAYPLFFLTLHISSSNSVTASLLQCYWRATA